MVKIQKSKLLVAERRTCVEINTGSFFIVV